MSGLIQDPELVDLYQPELLESESRRRYNLVRDAVLEQLRPRDFVEHMWAVEIVESEWETLRLRQFKSLIIKSARRPAVQSLLSALLSGTGSDDIEDLAERFFTNKRERKKSKPSCANLASARPTLMLKPFRQSITELAEINRRLLELGSRRDKILQQLEDYRAGLAKPISVGCRMSGRDIGLSWLVKGRLRLTARMRARAPDLERMLASSVRPRMPVVTGSASIPMKEKTPELLNPWRGALLKALRTNIFFTPPEPLRTLTWNSPAFARSNGPLSTAWPVLRLWARQRASVATSKGDC